MSRIAISDELVTGLTNMSEGNPGALNVLMQLVNRSAKMELTNVCSLFDYFSRLDSLEVYGASIWILYKDICGEKIEVMVEVLNAVGNNTVSQMDITKSILTHFPTEAVKKVLIEYNKGDTNGNAPRKR